MKIAIIALALFAVVAADVSSLGSGPSSDYLPPIGNNPSPISSPNQEYLPPVGAPEEGPEPAHSLSDDGYRYKTIRRIRYRFRH